MSRTLRLGIDVGGTFTDVVAVDAQRRTVEARVKIPTTHTAPEGVAAGIVAGIRALFEEHNVRPEEVAFIAHSTTQATNALLEGDVARVGVLGLTDAAPFFARMQMRFPLFDLAPGVPFDVPFAFANTRDPEDLGRALGLLQTANVQAVAVSQAFSVDRPDGEEQALSAAREHGFVATSGHEVSSMYGLRARTRTAALNAAILPKMTSTAQMTQQAVNGAAISVPLMIMRSDGGVMDVREMQRRPILTLLSGPAAGVAGALLHENVTDGIFIEVGGTSSDCSAIRAGMPQMRPARVGGHRTMLRTLDVRTLAIAGGSMPRIAGARIVDVGPRSAHIAGCAYACFSPPAVFEGARTELVRPTAHDPPDYPVIIAVDGARVALTPTCAANMLGFVPEDAFARGDARSARRGFEVLAAHMGSTPDALATAMLEIASAKLLAAIEDLIADYALDRQTLVVVGGGGGAAALVPFASRKAELDFRLARDAEVISPVGVALALVREVVERTIVDPSPGDIVRIRRQAKDAVVAAGAAADGVQVSVEIDPQRNLVRATAAGAAEIAQSSARADLDEQQIAAAAARLLRAQPDQVRLLARTSSLSVFESRRQHRRDLRVLDRSGVGRLSLGNADVRLTTAARASAVLDQAVEAATSFGDVGRSLPDLFLLYGPRIADFSGLASAQQVLALAQEELSGAEPQEPVVILTAPRPA